jgi:hypothetical protein
MKNLLTKLKNSSWALRMSQVCIIFYQQRLSGIITSMANILKKVGAESCKELREENDRLRKELQWAMNRIARLEGLA